VFGGTEDIKNCFGGYWNITMNVNGEVCRLGSTFKVCHYWTAADFFFSPNKCNAKLQMQLLYSKVYCTLFKN
jgi:hypothetical protein